MLWGYESHTLEVVSMPLLQVKDFPAPLYEELRAVAAADRRSIAQEVVILVEQGLLNHTAAARRRREQLLDFLDTQPPLALTIDPVEALRADRERPGP
jgi:hypothetical protein